MQRVLIAGILGLFACGSNASRGPAPTTAATPADGDDVVCGDEVSPTTGMTHRVCHRQLATSTEAGENDVECSDEVPTGTQLTKRVCRSKNEKVQNKAFVQDLYQDPSARPLFHAN
ncbi:MAG: hypothetical protein ABIY55_36005 [Kofleriaceae bacterium]